jgi:dTDP-glucose pyrophosphorylase/CBS domain-containing protein
VIRTNDEGRLADVTVAPTASITSAIRQLDRAGTGALLVCDGEGTLLGLVTDGDIRRAMLRGIPFSQPALSIARRDPLVAPAHVAGDEALRLMDTALGFEVNQLPLVDADGRARGLLLRRDLVTHERRALSALIMAGGFGTRMLPLTEHLPKPMLPVGDRPLLERTLTQMREAGIGRVAISTHHLADCITSHFGDGTELGMDLQYLNEAIPLGTAGALRLLPDVDGPLLVINGDILTGVPFEDMLAFHQREGAGMTVGMRRCELQLPYGLLDCDGSRIRDVREKPRQSFWANAGVYIVEAEARRSIPPDRRFDMTDLITHMLAEGRAVAGFPIVEYWLDIGQPADYARALADQDQLEAVR